MYCAFTCGNASVMKNAASLRTAYCATASAPHSASFATTFTTSLTLSAGPSKTTFDTGNTSSEDATRTTVSTTLTSGASIITLFTP